MYLDTEVLKPKECFKRYNRVIIWKQYLLSRKAYTLRPRSEWAPSDDLCLRVPVGNPTLIHRDPMLRILDMQMLQGSTDSCLLAAITNHLLNRIISQVMLINWSRLATYANHEIVTHEVYEITFCHNYKIVNVIQVYTMQTFTMSGVLHLNAMNKPSFISEDVAEIRINSQPCKGKTWQHDTWEPRRQTSGHLSLWLLKSWARSYLTLVLSSMRKPQRVVCGWPQHYPF
jgi:hypothetical protein